MFLNRIFPLGVRTPFTILCSKSQGQAREWGSSLFQRRSSANDVYFTKFKFVDVQGVVYKCIALNVSGAMSVALGSEVRVTNPLSEDQNTKAKGVLLDSLIKGRALHDASFLDGIANDFELHRAFTAIAPFKDELSKYIGSARDESARSSWGDHLCKVLCELTFGGDLRGDIVVACWKDTW